MKTELDPKFYKACECAFLEELARSINVSVRRVAQLSEEEKRSLSSSLTFAVAAHLSGSAFGGRVEGEEIYPKLSFYRDESDALIFGEGSRLHELVPDVLSKLAK